MSEEHEFKGPQKGADAECEVCGEPWYRHVELGQINIYIREVRGNTVTIEVCQHCDLEDKWSFARNSWVLQPGDVFTLKRRVT